MDLYYQNDTGTHALAYSHPPTTHSGPVQAIEATAKRSITIQTSPSSSILSKCHSQFQSPLFVLPAEIREIIFTLATAPYYAPGSFVDEEELNYRPDHKARWTTSVGLLATCRRVWLETNHLPMLQAHHCFYLPSIDWGWGDPTASALNLARKTPSLWLSNSKCVAHID